MRAYRAKHPGPRKKTQSRVCDIEDCIEPHFGRGFCQLHYDKEFRREYHAAWLSAHPEIRRRNQSKRRAIIKGAEATLTRGEWNEILVVFAGMCFYDCGRKWETFEHLIPLSKGGNHSKENVVPACKPCNFSKGSKDPDEFLESLIW